MLYSLIEDVQDLMSRGGWVLYVIFFVTLVMWFLILERVWYFKFNFAKEALSILDKWQKESLKPLSVYSLRIWKADLSCLNQLLNKNISSIKILVALCPLLGLLGTVTGMVAVFEVMAQIGTGNARLMASGISMATIPTMAGLLSALSGIYICRILENWVKKERHKAIAQFSPLRENNV